MGKSKSSKRFSGKRPTPTLPANLDILEENVDAENIPAVIVNILEQLKDPSKEERAIGCMHMSRIVAQPKAIELLLKQDIVKITAPLFLDKCVDVQRSALGAMRNMSIYGEETVCEVMVNDDIITPLTAVIKKLGESHGSGKESSNRSTVSSILLEAIELLSNLCENNDRALQIFNKEGILSILLPLLNPEACGYSLAIAVAHCLYIVAENNSELSRVCGEPDVFLRLTSFATSTPSCIDAILLRIKVVGIILNLSNVDLSKYYDCFIQAAGEVLETDYLPLITDAVKGAEGDAEQHQQLDGDLSQQDVDKLVAAQRVCLEMLANLCCCDDDWEEMEEEDCDDLWDEQVESTDDTVVSEQDFVESSLCLPSEIQAAFFKHNILIKIMKKAHSLEPSQVSLLESLHFGKVMLQRIEDLQARALLCLSNVITALYQASEPPSTPILSIWKELYSLALSDAKKNEDFIWAVTSAMRSVLQKMSEIDITQINNVSPSDLDFLVQLGTVSKNPETQINTIRMLSTIGCVFATDTECHAHVKTIGDILLHVCSSNDNLVVISEALDSLFDVFKEDETDSVAREINLVHQLKSLQPSFKSKVSSQRKNLGEHYGIVMMARSNLSPFLKYKMARRL